MFYKRYCYSLGFILEVGLKEPQKLRGSAAAAAAGELLGFKQIQISAGLCTVLTSRAMAGKSLSGAKDH